MERIAYDRLQASEDTHWWFRGRRHILSRVIQGLALPEDARILEVGCGAGGNIPMLREFGDLTLMEPDRPCRDNIRTKFGLDVLAGALPDDAPLEDAAFDLVCAFDIIEHLDADLASLARMRGALREDGYLVATVPAYGWMWSRHDELHHHKRRYTLEGFRTLFIQAGYDVVRASYFNTLLFPPAAMVRMGKTLTRSEREDDATPSPVVNDMLSRIFASESIWLDRADLPFGLSILVVARRSHRPN